MEIDSSRRRAELLTRIVDDVALHGLGDRSLRDLAAAVGSSHRMLIYHFGSRDGLVRAIVGAVEATQRSLMTGADVSSDPVEVARDMWRRVSDPSMRPFVQLFFEAAAYSSRINNGIATAADNLTTDWIDEFAIWSTRGGRDVDPVEVRLAIAVTRGLLVDIISGGDIDDATRAFEYFLALRSAASMRSTVGDVVSQPR